MTEPASIPFDHRDDARAAMDALVATLAPKRRWFVLTGAGVSTASGIPDYRDRTGAWKRPQPVRFGPFVRNGHVRKRYWSRALLGWKTFTAALPGRAHRALADLEAAGRIETIVTQNVDRLHQRAGSRRVVDLHGRLDRIVCLGCERRSDRARFQELLAARNPVFASMHATPAPDGDADLSGVDLDGFDVPTCEACRGTLKPDVVFFGESVPKARVDRAFDALRRSDAVLVVGSSLMVWSGFRFVREAGRLGIPVVAINVGVTRADDALAVKVEVDCGVGVELLSHPNVMR